MKLLLALWLCVIPAWGSMEISTASILPVHRMAREIEKDGVLGLSRQMDKALNAMVKVGIAQLKSHGKYVQGEEFRVEWESRFQGYLERMILMDDIGDHAPLSVWLDTFYTTVELAIGVDICVKLRLSDIKTLNSGIPVVLAPCTFSMSGIIVTRRAEYELNFVQGSVYRGVFPVAVYWVVSIGCGFSGAGFPVCMPIAMAAEYVARDFIGPRLSDRIQDGCN